MNARTRGNMPRASMSAQERELRSRIKQLVTGSGLLRGSPLVRRNRCGNKGCKCWVKDERHESLAIQVSVDGRSQQFHVPKAMREEVLAWVDNYQELRKLLDEIGLLYLDRVNAR
ncbi:MAG: DUF6788 family protein [Planctomycetota bacterium]